MRNAAIRLVLLLGLGVLFGSSGYAQNKTACELLSKADTGDANAQLALGRLYQSGSLASDGSVQHDYVGAAYWYHQASEHDEAQAAYQLAILYRDGLGVPADASLSFQLLQKASEANFVQAISLLSDVYAEQKTTVSGERATYLGDDWGSGDTPSLSSAAFTVLIHLASSAG
jgi:TPR repeat protein